jgi:ketosteroid isomerase-like protein
LVSQAAEPTISDGPDAPSADFVARFEKAWGESDPDALLELLTDNVRLIQPTMTHTVGKQAARKQFAALLEAIPDLHVEVHRWAARDDVLFIEFTLIGTYGGRELSWPAVDRFLLRDGLAAERISYFDPLPIAAALVTRPRGWRRLLASGFRPNPFASTSPKLPT